MILTKQILDEIDWPGYKEAKGYVGRYQGDWKQILSEIIMPSKLGIYRIWCVICSCDVNVLISGV